MRTHKLILSRVPMGYPFSGIAAHRWRSVGKVRFGVGGVFGTTGCQGTGNRGLGEKLFFSAFFVVFPDFPDFLLDRWYVRLVN